VTQRMLWGLAAALVVGVAGAQDLKPRDLRLFYASGMAAVVEGIRDDAERDARIRLQPEPSGSQMVCRKLADLQRPCDLVILADPALVKEMLAGHCSWRMDFAHDEVVLAVGARAPRISEAEEDWPSVLLRDDVRLARADETLAPIGYRTLMVWQLQERLGRPGLAAALQKRCDKVVEDVAHLTPLLKLGDSDYAFVFRSTCVAHDLRFIDLDPCVNLSDPGVDYSAACVTFPKSKAGSNETVTIRGAPAAWTLSIPDRNADAETARRFVRFLLVERAAAMKKNGFRVLKKPRFYGTEAAFQPFSDFAERAGSLE